MGAYYGPPTYDPRYAGPIVPNPGYSPLSPRSAYGRPPGTLYPESRTTGRSSRFLPEPIRRRSEAWLDEMAGEGGVMRGRTGEGYDFARRGVQDLFDLGISPEEEEMFVSRALDPVAGSGENARQQLMRYYAASGNFNPGLNATLERVQQEQGRQGAEAARDARLGVMAERRSLAQAAAGAAQNLFGSAQAGQLGTQGQLGSALTNYPEYTGTSAQETRSTSGGGGGGGGDGGGGGSAAFGGGGAGVATGLRPKRNQPSQPPPEGSWASRLNRGGSAAPRRNIFGGY